MGGLSVDGLSISGPYSLSGTGIALGSGGLTLNTVSSGTTGNNDVQLAIPATLSAPQTWSMGSFNQLTISGNVTGSGQALTFANSGPDFVDVSSDIEVGSVTIPQADIFLEAGASLNGTNGNPVDLVGNTFLTVGSSAAVGALTLSGSFSGGSGLTLGTGSAGVLSVNGGVTLAPSAGFATDIVHAGSVSTFVISGGLGG